MKLFRIFGGSLLALLGLSAAALAQLNAALVVEASDVPQAPALYSELAAGTTIDLGKGTLKFLHYQTCKEIVVSGGSVTVNAADFTVDDGEIVSESDQPCPQPLRMVRTRTRCPIGLGVMCCIQRMTEVGEYPSVVIVGPKADKISSVTFLQEDGKSVAEVSVTDNHIVWNESAPSLIAGHNYTMVLKSDGNTEMEERVYVPFPSKAGMVLVRTN